MQDAWKNKNNRLNNVLPIYFLPVEEILWAFIKTNLDFADQGKRRSQRLDSRSRLKNQFRKLVSRSDSKVLSFENELVRKVIVTTSGKDSTRRITRHASLDYNVNENEILKTMLLWFVVYVSDWIFVNICVIYLYFIMRYV